MQREPRCVKPERQFSESISPDESQLPINFSLPSPLFLYSQFTQLDLDALFFIPHPNGLAECTIGMPNATQQRYDRTQG